ANYLQETAGNQVRNQQLSVKDLLDQGYAWILMRQWIRINRLPEAQENLRVTTYPAGIAKYYLYRDFNVYDAHNELLAFASSIWLVMDIKRRSMVSIPPFISSKFEIPKDIDFYPPPEYKIPKLKEVSQVNQYKAGWLDLDQNAHVNNAYYYKWVLESLPVDILEQKRLKEIDLFYRAESRLHDEVESQGQKILEDEFVHRLWRASDQKELAQARTLWASS
ncbi:MAG: acyl-ACP thioesterase domain-containing protein, partial [Bacteroidota bacterium]